MEALAVTVEETAQVWEQDGGAAGEVREIIGAVDETFLEQLILVFQDVSTGYIVQEEVADDRTYATWKAVVDERLQALGTRVLSLVSDRAKALIKLAHTGLGCLSIPDLFHLSHDLAKGYSLAIFGRLRQAKRGLEHAQQRLETLQQNAQAERVHIEQGQARVAACATTLNHWQGVGSAWRQRLSNVSRILHPWRLLDSIRSINDSSLFTHMRLPWA